VPFSEKDAAEFVAANKAHVNRLRKTITNLITAQHVLYYYKKLQALDHDSQAIITMDWSMEVEAITTTIVMFYGRLFSESNGTPVLKKKLIPQHLQSAHEEIILLRNERYAHHGNHGTTSAEIELFVAEDSVEMKLHWWSSSYGGAAPHWGELFSWIHEFIKNSFMKQLTYLSETSGKEWHSFDPTLEIEDITVKGEGK